MGVRDHSIIKDMLDNIIHGDCIDVIKNIPNESIDLTVTSPPYDSRRDYKGYVFDYKLLARELYRVTKNGGVVVWVVGDETEKFCETLTSFKQAIYFVEDIGFKLLDTMIYMKKGGPPAYPTLRRYTPMFEYMFVFIKGYKPITFNPLKDRKNIWAGTTPGFSARQKDGSLKTNDPGTVRETSLRHNVWEYDVGRNKDTKDEIAYGHPARFPESLARDHILSWSNEGDIVLDPMCGSGTTCKMALLNNRHYIGIEIAEEYIQIARDRIRKSKLVEDKNDENENHPNALERWV